MYVIGVIGVVISRRSIIRVLMSLEIMMLGINVYMIGSGIYMDDKMGEIMAMIVLTVVGAETAIGLGLIIVYYRRQ